MKFWTAFLHRLKIKKNSDEEKTDMTMPENASPEEMPPAELEKKPEAAASEPVKSTEETPPRIRWGGWRSWGRRRVLLAGALIIMTGILLSLFLFFSPAPPEEDTWGTGLKAIPPLSAAEEDLFQAIREGDGEGVRRALRADASANAMDSSGISAMRAAIFRNRLDIVRELIAAGYDESALGDVSPLMFAIAHDRGEIVRELLTPDKLNMVTNGRSPLIYAVERAYEETVRVILDAGADINMPDQTGDTPLMLAAKAGKAEIVSILLRTGANVLARSPNGETALDMAQKRHRKVVASLLIEAEMTDSGRFERGVAQ